MTHELSQAFENSIILLRQGTTVEDCLARYPEQSDELKPLLQSITLPQTGGSSQVPATTRARIRGRVMSAWDQRYSARQRRRRHHAGCAGLRTRQSTLPGETASRGDTAMVREVSRSQGGHVHPVCAGTRERNQATGGDGQERPRDHSRNSNGKSHSRSKPVSEGESC